MHPENKIITLNLDHPDYPRAVTDLNRPPTLYRVGRTPRWPIVAIIGSRQASEYGLYMVNRIVDQLSGYQVTIASGLAYGIDSAAQEVALRYSLPVLAVLPTGLDQVYPRGNQALAEAILTSGGSWYSLSPPRTVLAKYHFLQQGQEVKGNLRLKGTIDLTLQTDKNTLEFVDFKSGKR
ncbi:MAG: DNA processing SMF protein, partial [Candidatus Berkelbacteria bacterium Gr01-1014_85]